MTDRTELARDLAVLADERRDPGDRHPSDDELAFFAAGDLPAQDRDRIEEHVATCARDCGRRLLAAFEDLEEFESNEPVADEPAHLSDRREIETRGRALADELIPQTPNSPPWQRHLALAMAVLAGMVGGYLVSEVLRDSDKQIVVGEPLVTLNPDESRDRSIGEDIKVFSGSGDFVLLLRSPRGADDFPGYMLDVRGSGGLSLVVPIDGEMAQKDYGLTVRLPGILPSGTYRLTLVGHEREIATYEVEIRRTP